MTGHCSRKVDCFTYNVTLKWVFGLVQTLNFSCSPPLSVCPFPSFPLFLFHPIRSSYIPNLLNAISSKSTKTKKSYTDVGEHTFPLVLRMALTVWNHFSKSSSLFTNLAQLHDLLLCAIICNIVWDAHISSGSLWYILFIAFPSNKIAAPQCSRITIIS